MREGGDMAVHMKNLKRKQYKCFIIAGNKKGVIFRIISVYHKKIEIDRSNAVCQILGIGQRGVISIHTWGGICPTRFSVYGSFKFVFNLIYYYYFF